MVQVAEVGNPVIVDPQVVVAIPRSDVSEVDVGLEAPVATAPVELVSGESHVVEVSSDMEVELITFPQFGSR